MTDHLPCQILLVSYLHPVITATMAKHGNGEIIKIKDISDEYPISLSKVKKALLDANFGDAEISLILCTLQNTNIADID